ncbi:uncharacterized protein GLRG_00175 [Colletotrichum graminicola M1.001]|uniref:Uncharacterized protein n=1 Tax=Colletotrichum graminicola (strain M1.001 / M2 / FGSC 10212) TaxID=645133 RepID=E3Q352_COLGM|nr:uncharacterized protein GLRG_00175 [Colletotrichum graminicola M1.001]EFQ25031.1 hypothetical protein GLRG_00175 [Colletotrichum graminicola M1.001]
MAPNPLCLAWRDQIIDNLRLISGRSAVFDIYTSRHPNKSFTIYAVKVHRGKRQEVLSAMGRDLEDAFENLHTKSSQEVYQFIDANGFAFPRGVKSISGQHDDEGSETSSSEASTVSTSDVLSLSAASSDGEDDNVRKGKKKKSCSRRKSKRKSKKDSRHHKSSSSSGEEEEEDSDSGPEIAMRRRPTALVSVTRPSYIPATHIPGSQYPPLPPPGWRGPPTRVHPRAPAAGMPPPAPTFPPGMRPPQQHHQGVAAPVVPSVPTAPSKPVRLVVKWRGHGEKRIIENCAPSHRALQRAALAHVRSQWQTFENVVAQEMTPGRLWGLCAKVRRVALGKDMYAISAAGGDDLGMYYKAEDIPMFEIDVDHDGNIMPPPPPPPPLLQHLPQH